MRKFVSSVLVVCVIALQLCAVVDARADTPTADIHFVMARQVAGVHIVADADGEEHKVVPPVDHDICHVLNLFTFAPARAPAAPLTDGGDVSFPVVDRLTGRVDAPPFQPPQA